MNASGAQGGAWGAAPAASSSTARCPRPPVACQSDDNGAMPRTTQQLHPHREPVATRAAATVLLLPDAPDAAGAGGQPAADRRATQSELQLTQAIAAIRESFEELGVLLARHADGRMADAQ